MRASLALELYSLLHLPITRKECAALEYSTVPVVGFPQHL